MSCSEKEKLTSILITVPVVTTQSLIIFMKTEIAEQTVENQDKRRVSKKANPQAVVATCGFEILTCGLISQSFLMRTVSASLQNKTSPSLADQPTL